MAALKKSLDEIVKNQTENLEKAVGSRRMWTQEGWRGLFEKNPIMHIFAEKLVWGFYNNGKLEASFIYSNDGSIVNNDYDNLDFEQYPQMHIGFVHPLELTPEELDSWREYLSDQDIHTQPVNQLNRPIFRKADYSGNKIDIFGGKIVNALSFASRLSKKGWYKNFYDHYSCKSMSKRSGSFEAVIHNSYLLLQVSYTESATISWLRFFNNEKEENISNLPDIFFSEVMNDLTVATEKAYDFDENWKKEGRRDRFC